MHVTNMDLFVSKETITGTCVKEAKICMYSNNEFEVFSVSFFCR